MEKIKLYITGPGETGMGKGEGSYILVAETGEALYSHYCSSAGYAEHDLIDEEWRPDRIIELNEKYGKDNWEVLFLGEDDMTHDILYQRNQEWMASLKENKNDKKN